MAQQTLILSIPGTQEMREMELDAVRHGVAQGEIGLDNWVWSPAQNDWLPLAQLPEFTIPVVPTPATSAHLEAARVVTPAYVPGVRANGVAQVTPATAQAGPATVRAPISEKVIGAATGAPVAARTISAAAPAPAASQAPAPSNGVPSVAARAATPPQVAATRAAVMETRDSKRLAATYYSKPLEEHHEFPIFKILFVVLGLLIAGLVGVNYYKVEQPFRQELAQTGFATLPAHAHLGAFVQPNALLIHIFPNNQITSDNFADVLMALTRSAPREAFAGRPFTTVGLTSSWLAQYVITDENWSGFMDMSGFSQDQKREYVLTHLETNSGQDLVPYMRKETPAQHQDRETKIWNDLVANFQGKAPQH